MDDRFAVDLGARLTGLGAEEVTVGPAGASTVVWRLSGRRHLDGERVGWHVDVWPSHPSGTFAVERRQGPFLTDRCVVGRGDDAVAVAVLAADMDVSGVGDGSWGRLAVHPAWWVRLLVAGHGDAPDDARVLAALR